MDTASDFELPDQDGNPWRLDEHLGHGPLILVFYRGDW
jgi:peroxiredoxin